MVARRVLLGELSTEDDKVVSTVQGMAGEDFESEVYQLYGFSANPAGENESIVIEHNGSADNYIVLPPCGYERAEEGETLIYSGKSKISIKEDSITIIVGGAQKLEIKDDKIIVHSDLEVNGDIKTTGDIRSEGDVVAGVVSLQKHVHSGVWTGPGTTGTPVGGE